MRKNLWLAVILLSLKLHLVLGHDCEIEKVERKPNQNVMETTAKCTQGKVKMTLVEYIEENKVPIIEFFCTETERVHNDREKCANKTARCKLPNLDGINRLFNQSDFDNIAEFKLLFEDFQLKLPGDVFTIFPNVVALELRFTDPFYESGGKWPDSLTLFKTYHSNSTNLAFPEVSSIKELEIKTPCKCLSNEEFNITDLNFTSLENLEYLQFEWCDKLTNLPPNAFRSAKTLKKLKLNNNKLTMIDKDALKGLPELEFIDFEFEFKLTELPIGFFGNAPNLKAINIFYTKLSLNESVFGQNQLQYITTLEAEHVDIRDEMGFFEMISKMVKLETLELKDNPLTLNSLMIKKIPPSVKDLKETFCGKVSKKPSFQETCPFALAMNHLNNTAKLDQDCFNEIELTNGTKLTDKIEECEDEKKSQMKQRIGIIASISVFGFLIFCYITWKYAIVPKMPWFYSSNICARCFFQDREDLEYDVFATDFVEIYYSQMEEAGKIMKEVSEKLRNGHNNRRYKVATYKDNHLIGPSIENELKRLADLSKRTIAIVTKGALESHIFLLTVQVLTSIERYQKLIVILSEPNLLEQLQNRCEPLAVHIKNHSCLVLEEPHFWEKLHYKLPHKQMETMLQNHTQNRKPVFPEDQSEQQPYHTVIELETLTNST